MKSKSKEATEADIGGPLTLYSAVCPPGHILKGGKYGGNFR